MMLPPETAILFFQKDPSLLFLYREVEAAILKRLPETTLRAGKSQIAFRNRYNYTFVSLPIRRIKGWPDHCLILTFGLGYHLEHPRVAQAVEPYPGRWTHHVLVNDPADLDEELLSWVEEAYWFSQKKSRSR
jgi:hypothetical protein